MNNIKRTLVVGIVLLIVVLLVSGCYTPLERGLIKGLMGM